ncbi:hypothetical protein RND71_043040 [Anisodus tanguticus]|uniref:Knottins-like domain-containing protein n=1 Tax=Anisodus tanguticus TaxID=243964 RepID=A0AAE1QTD8_9SOLA|nr:hypothetical protein RND71_043040 [Anisodus tanguticus]
MASKITFCALLFCFLLMFASDIEAAEDEICKQFSSTFSGQCYESAHCEETCIKEGSSSGECQWKGIHWGYACMCEYIC